MKLLFPCGFVRLIMLTYKGHDQTPLRGMWIFSTVLFPFPFFRAYPCSSSFADTWTGNYYICWQRYYHLSLCCLLCHLVFVVIIIILRIIFFVLFPSSSFFCLPFRPFPFSRFSLLSPFPPFLSFCRRAIFFADKSYLKPIVGGCHTPPHPPSEDVPAYSDF